MSLRGRVALENFVSLFEPGARVSGADCVWFTTGSVAADQFWRFTVYDKDEAADLSASERKALGAMLIRESEARNTK